MKTTDFAINKIYSLLSGAVIVPVHKLTKPTKEADPEYIVVNALPISEGVLQKCHVNVNYHVKDKAPGIPDVEKLESGTATLMNILQTVSETGILIDFESQEYHRESPLNEHYSNIRLSVKIINN